jgi:hypothetical protein
MCIPTFNRVNKLKQGMYRAINQRWHMYLELANIDNNSERDCETVQLVMNCISVRINFYKNLENIGSAGNLNRLFKSNF